MHLKYILKHNKWIANVVSQFFANLPCQWLPRALRFNLPHKWKTVYDEQSFTSRKLHRAIFPLCCCCNATAADGHPCVFNELTFLNACLLELTWPLKLVTRRLPVQKRKPTCLIHLIQKLKDDPLLPTMNEGSLVSYPEKCYKTTRPHNIHQRFLLNRIKRDKLFTEFLCLPSPRQTNTGLLGEADRRDG